MDAVPSFVAPDQARFEVLPSGLPLLMVDLEADALRAVPLPTTDRNAAEDAAPLTEWQLLPRPTMTVVDGPGDLGFLVGILPTELDASATWVDAAIRHGGAIVYFTAMGSGEGGRGGFIPLVT